MITIRNQSFSFWLPSWVVKQTFCLGASFVSLGCHTPGEGGGGRAWQSLMRGGSALRSNPLPFHLPFWQKRYPLYEPFIEKRYPFHIPTLEHYTPFLSPCNEVNEQYYERISRITRRNTLNTAIRNILNKGPFKYLNDRFPYPFLYLTLWNPFPFL